MRTLLELSRIIGIVSVLAAIAPWATPSSADSTSSNTRILSFNQAKRLAGAIYVEHPYTLYCGCRFTGKRIDLESCGYLPQRDPRRAQRLEWEHVVPAEAFGQSFAEWRQGDPRCVRKGRAFRGRKCAETNAEFARIEGDLYNLWPEVGELNGLRSNYSMAEIGALAGRSPASLSFGGCQARILDRKFEPMDSAKGVVARTYLYMDQAYPGRGIVSNKNQKLFEAWDQLHPPTAWECQRARKIQKIQGNVISSLAGRC